MYLEDELLPISALQHLMFCPRQWGLIHLEQAWQENALTAQGRIMHQRVHEADTESRADFRITRGLRLHSYSLGLTGQADVVEFHLSDTGAELPGAKGRWQPIPVEYKRGKPKMNRCDEVQLCAQVVCLEEMLKVSIPQAAFFYGKPKRRHQVTINPALRNETARLALELHALTQKGKTPQADLKNSKKCKSCSLLNICLPQITGIKKKVDYYIRQHMKSAGTPTHEKNA